MKLVILDAYAANPGDITWKPWEELGIEFKSRDPKEIRKYVESAKRGAASIERSKKIQKEVLDIIDGIIKEVNQ